MSGDEKNLEVFTIEGKKIRKNDKDLDQTKIKKYSINMSALAEYLQ